MKQKKVLSFLLVLSLLLVMISACGTPAAQGTAASTTTTQAAPAAQTTAVSAATTAAPAAQTTAAVKELKIGWAQNASDENMNRFADAFTGYIDKWNAAGKTPKVIYVKTNAETNLDKQISDIDSLIAQKVDVIFSNAVDTVGILPAVAKARAAGIKWVEQRGVARDKVDVTYNLSEKTMAEMAAKWWHALLDSKPDLKINAGLIYGLASQTEQLKRVDLLVDDLTKAYPDRFKVLVKDYADWDTNKAMTITENWLQSQKTMNCIIAAGAQEALGAVNAVVAAKGDMDKWYFTTTDATTDALSMLHKGQLDMTVGINPAAQGEEAAQLSIEVGTGAFKGDWKDAAPGDLFTIDATNIAQYYKGN